MPEGPQWTLLYSTVLLVLCTLICAVGSSLFAKSGKVLFVILLVSVVSIPLSVLIVKPFFLDDIGLYTGLSWHTFKGNFLPRFTKGAAGSDIKGRQNFQNMFGILFPATSGIFAGASMSGDLRKPSKSIPQGTLWGLLSTFVLYSLVIIAIGSSVPRQLLHRDIQVIQDVNLSSYLILMGELSTSLYSALMGVTGASKLLQAISRDNLLPFTSIFASPLGNNNTKPGGDDNPIRAILLTYALAQVTLFFDINQIAVFITMAYLMTFVVTNLACFLLKIASAPNFRPSFRYFNTATAGVGAFACVAAMFVADRESASAMIIFLALLFWLIHYISPPKPWGDVSQSLIYHQVRKYLLRLRQDHVKFWRPQILLLVDDPRTSWSLIHFCNHLKKGGLYILGHVVITKDFQESFPELKKQQDAWNRLRTVSNVKGFVQIGAGPDVVWGARNVYIGSGLGGMKPNITVLGFFEKRNHLSTSSSSQTPPNHQGSSTHQAIDIEHLPTDICRKEPPITVTQWVHIIEDLLTMQANVAVAKGFPKLQFPSPSSPMAPQSYLNIAENHGYIDLYPIQMSAQITDENGRVSALTTNFDTYTLILQMGAILRTVPDWKKNHELRVIVFVEFEEDVESEHTRIKLLLDKLRIKASILVRCLSSGDVPAYETVIHGKPDVSGRVTQFLGNDEWWQELQSARYDWETGEAEEFPTSMIEELIPSEQHSHQLNSSEMRTINQQQRRSRRHTLSSLQRLGVSLTMQTNKITRNDIYNATSGYYDEHEVEYDNDSETDYGASNSTTKPGSEVSSLGPSAPPSAVQTPSGLPQPVAAMTIRDSDSIFSEASAQPDYFNAGFQYGRTPGGATPYPPSQTAAGDAAPGSGDDDDYGATVEFPRQPASTSTSQLLPPPPPMQLQLPAVPPFRKKQHHHSRTPSGLSQTQNVDGSVVQQQPKRPVMNRTVSGSQVNSPQSPRPSISRTHSGPVPKIIKHSTSDDSLKSRASSPSRSPHLSAKSSLAPPSAPGSPSLSPRPPLVSRPSLMKTLSRSGSQADLTRAKKLKPNFSGLTMPSTKVLDDADDKTNRTIMFEDDDKANKENTGDQGNRRRSIKFDTDETAPLLTDKSKQQEHGYSSITKEPKGTATAPKESPSSDTPTEDGYLSFNDLPAKAQHVILNDLMRRTSGDAAVIFSTLPAPSLGTHNSVQDSQEYVENLDLWCDDLPPVILLHSQSMTVTTAL